MIPGKMVPGMGGAMDLVTGARRVIVAMQHTAKGRSKIVRECLLPLTSARPVDLVVTELAVIAFPEGRATLVETTDGVTVAQVIDATEAELVVPRDLSEPRSAKAAVLSPLCSRGSMSMKRGAPHFSSAATTTPGAISAVWDSARTCTPLGQTVKSWLTKGLSNCCPP